MLKLAFRDLRFQRLGAMRASASELQNFGGLSWILSGIYDDTIPTSDAWSDAVGWLFNGVWDDAVPTGAATWNVPDGTGYTIWTDSEVTV